MKNEQTSATVGMSFTVNAFIPPAFILNKSKTSFGPVVLKIESFKSQGFSGIRMNCKSWGGINFFSLQNNEIGKHLEAISFFLPLV